MTLRILLLQARNEDDPMRLAERRSFAARTGLSLDQIVPHDLLEGPPGLGALESNDALMVGGSGDYYVSNQTLPHFAAQLEFLQEVVERGHPMFASCFGFQILVVALGGEVIYDPQSMEVGTYDSPLRTSGRALTRRRSCLDSWNWSSAEVSAGIPTGHYDCTSPGCQSLAQK